MDSVSQLAGTSTHETGFAPAEWKDAAVDDKLGTWIRLLRTDERGRYENACSDQTKQDFTERLGPSAVDPRYYAVQSNFETADPGWKFWQYFRKDKAADVVTNVIFEGPNDLVVDTSSMTDFGVPNLQLAAQPWDFGTTDQVWHCNYFRQPQTIAYLTQSFT